MARMRLPIACFLLSLLNFDAPHLRIHQHDCLIVPALCNEPENAFRPSLYTRRNYLVTRHHRKSVQPPSRRFLFQFDSLIVETQAGENRNPNNQGYTYGFVMHFVDAEHLKAYAPHPAHQVVSKELQAMCESIIDFDIE